LRTFSGLLRFARNDASFFFALYAFFAVNIFLQTPVGFADTPFEKGAFLIPDL